jgi:RNA polymerase sigma factor (sigma-70 family)
MRERHYGSDMRDSEVVAAIVAGDPAGLAEAYDRYAALLYNYCRTLLGEPADAADAVQDTFLIAASRLSGLRDRDRLRSWLYAVARNECRRRVRSGGEPAPLEEARDMTDEAADVSAGAEKAELRALVRDALMGLGSAEREILELQLRQGLASGEVAGVLGISRNHAHALLSRARDQLEAAFGVLVVARAGRQDCPALDRLLKGWDGRLTVLLRNRVNRHIEHCPACSERRRREMAPAMFLGTLPIAAWPLAAAALPAGFRNQVLRVATGNSPQAVAHRAAASRITYPFGHHGFPKPLDPPATQGWHHVRPVHVGAAAGAAAAVTLAVTVVATPPHHAPRPGGRTAGTGPVASAAVPTATLRARSTARPGSGASGGHQSPSATATQPSASPSASASATLTSPPASGTLRISPTTLDVVPPATGTITLTAVGGPVDWTVREPPGLTRKVVVSPMSGTLAAGATGTVTVTVTGPGKPHVHLTFSPGGTTVTVVVG